MTDRRDRSADIHMRDGVLRKGRVLGHSDASGRIREADTPLRRGDELGSIDEKQRIRRKGGLFRKGEVIARIRGNAVYASEGLLTGGLKIGYVDEHGHVWQTNSNAFRGRIVGKARGADPEAALAYFVLKFQEVEDAVSTLEEKIRVSEDKYAFLPRVRAMQKLLPEVDALGDFDSIVRRLDSLEEVSATDLGHHFTEERARIVESTRQKISPESTLEALRREFEIGVPLPLEQAEALVGRVRGALGVLSEGRRRNRGDNTPAEVSPATTPSRPPPAPEAKDERDETASRVEQILEVALGPVDRLRDEIDRIRKDPEYGAEEMIERLRTAMTSVVEHSDSRRAHESRPSAPRRLARAQRFEAAAASDRAPAQRRATGDHRASRLSPSDRRLVAERIDEPGHRARPLGTRSHGNARVRRDSARDARGRADLRDDRSEPRASARARRHASCGHRVRARSGRQAQGAGDREGRSTAVELDGARAAQRSAASSLTASVMRARRRSDTPCTSSRGGRPSRASLRSRSRSPA